MPETTFITKDWENARTAPHYTMISWYYSTSKVKGLIYEFKVQYHDFLAIIPRQLPWYNITKFCGIIPCFSLRVVLGVEDH